METHINQPDDLMHLVLRPDAKGRINLGKLAEGISSYHATHDRHGNITLKPYSEIPHRERWLFENKEALRKVLKGIEESAQGKTHYRGSFEQYLDEEID